MIRIRRANTILYSARFAETAQFYRSLLGAEAVSFENDWFVELAIGDGSFVSVADASRATIPAGGRSGITLSWEVGDVRALGDTLRSAGVEVTDVHHRFGAPVVDLHDPDGRRIELWSRAT